ncbi:MAG: cytochrome c biogenesis protein ResB [Pseudomonadota bacterium]
MRLTVVLLLSLAVTSVFGTLIPQNESPAAYVQTYGERGYRLLAVLDLFDMYHAWWFQLLLILLTANIVICSIDRLPGSWKLARRKPGRIHVDRFRKTDTSRVLTLTASVDDLRNRSISILKKQIGVVTVEPGDNGVVLFAEKWRWSRLGVYAVHLSIVLLLTGGIIGSLFGFEGFVNIPEGEARGVIHLRSDARQTRQLDFEIRCDDFDVSFYDTGQPKEYRSDLTLLKNGVPVFQKRIVVNDPIRFEGVNLFQSSYGQIPGDTLVLGFTSNETGMTYREKVQVGGEVTLQENLGTFRLIGFNEEANFKGHPIGPAFTGEISSPGADPQAVLLPVRFPGFDRMRQGAVTVSIVEQGERYYTGLQVTRDPGVWVVYAGFVMMILGCVVTFFMSHQQMCIAITDTEDGVEVMVGGISNKNPFGIYRKVERIVEALDRDPAASV